MTAKKAPAAASHSAELDEFDLAEFAVAVAAALAPEAGKRTLEGAEKACYEAALKLLTGYFGGGTEGEAT